MADGKKNRANTTFGLYSSKEHNEQLITTLTKPATPKIKGIHIENPVFFNEEKKEITMEDAQGEEQAPRTSELLNPPSPVPPQHELSKENQSESTERTSHEDFPVTAQNIEYSEFSKLKPPRTPQPSKEPPHRNHSARPTLPPLRSPFFSPRNSLFPPPCPLKFPQCQRTALAPNPANPYQDHRGIIRSQQEEKLLSKPFSQYTRYYSLTERAKHHEKRAKRLEIHLKYNYCPDPFDLSSLEISEKVSALYLSSLRAKLSLLTSVN